MAKNWRLAVCTRWRPLVGSILVSLSVLCTTVIGNLVYTTVDKYPTQRLERRIHKVKVGMSLAELETILGPPDSKTDIGGPNRIVEYGYSPANRFVGIHTQYKGILVDEKVGEVVSVALSESQSFGGIDGLDFRDEWAGLIAIGLIALVVLVVLLLFRRWCQSVTDADGDK